VLFRSLGLVRSTGRVKLTMRAPQQDALVSAASIGDDVVFLEVEASGGAGHVSRWSSGTITPLFDIAAPPSIDLYPANPDAIAVNAKGDVALIRTPSGGEPPTASTPALLYQTGQSVAALAPWSTLTTADDPACKSDTGFRAILQTVGPWFKLSSDLTAADARMLARVKWSAARVCLEGLEIRTPDVKATVMQRDGESPSYAQAITPESWLVARFAGGSSAMRAGIGPGVEWRQALSCTIQPP